MTRTLFVDVETTGLIKNSLLPLERQPHVIEFFGLSQMAEFVGGALNFGVETTHHSLFKQKEKLPYIITSITGITDEMLVGQPEFKEKAEELKALIEGHDEVVAHNAAFDKGMLDFEFKRAGLEVKWPTVICTIESTMHMKGYRLKLAELYEILFSEKFEGAHRAEADVRALARCFWKLREMGQV